MYIIYSVETYGECVENGAGSVERVWNYSTIVCFAMQVIISNERMVVIQ